MASLFIDYLSSAKLVELINSVDPNGEMVVSLISYSWSVWHA